MLLLATSTTEFKILATTVDEAIGRCIDRVARLMKLDWRAQGPGAALEQFASEDISSDATDIPTFPKPLSGQLTFSFAGFHSYMDIYLRGQGGIETFDVLRKRRLARAFQASVFAHLEEKVLLALDWCAENNIYPQGVIVSGGVASNQCLRERCVSSCYPDLSLIPSLRLRQCLASSPRHKDIRLVFPPASLCTGTSLCHSHPCTSVHRPYLDNAAMIAWASMHRFLASDHDTYDIIPRPKWSIEDI